MVLARNTISGQVADVSPKLLQHPKFKNILEVVEDGAKPYVAELYKGGTKEEKKTARKPKAAKETVEVVEAIDLVDDAVEEIAAVEENIEIEEDK